MRKTFLNIEASNKSTRHTRRSLVAPLHISTESPSEKTYHPPSLQRLGQTTSTNKSLEQYSSPKEQIRTSKFRLNTSHEQPTKLNHTLNSSSTKNIISPPQEGSKQFHSRFFSSANSQGTTPFTPGSRKSLVSNIDPVEFTIQIYQNSHQTPKRQASELGNPESWKDIITKKLSKVEYDQQSINVASKPLLTKIRHRIQVRAPPIGNRPNTSQNYSKLFENRNCHVDTILNKVRENVGDIAKNDLERVIKHTNKITNQYMPDKKQETNLRLEPVSNTPIVTKTESGFSLHAHKQHVTAEQIEAYGLCKDQEIKDSVDKMAQNLDDYTQAFYCGLIDISQFNMDSQQSIYKKAQKSIKANANAKTESTNRGVLRKRFANSVKRCKEKLERLHLTVDQVVRDRVFAIKPFESQHSEELIKMCREGDFNRVQVRVEMNRNLVNDFDLLGNTGLHWAAKRGHQNIVSLLLEKGADPDAEDMCQRTPLMLAAKGGYAEIVRMMCLAGANPLKKSDGKKTAEQYTDNEEIKRILHRVKSKELAMLMKSSLKVRETRSSFRKDDWRF